MDKTQPLPVFKNLFAPSLTEPRRRYPRTTESVAATQRLDVVR